MRATQLHARASYTRLPPRATLSRWWSKVSSRMAGKSDEPWRDPQHFSRSRWWDANTVAVVTGANKGIGKECVRQLAAQGVTVVATARSKQLGEAAVAEVHGDGGRVLFHQVRWLYCLC
jgi:3-oxoacyl-ACP reductase-like protein